MSSRWLRRSVAAVPLAVLVLAVQVPTVLAKDPLPEGVGATQLKADVESLKAGLAKKAKTSVKPLKAQAMLIALNAQNQVDGTDGEAMAGLRDTALRIVKALSQEQTDFDTAIKEAEQLGSTKGDVKAEAKLDKAEFDINELMTLFKPKNRGGRGLEATVQGTAKAGVKDVKAALEVGTHIALIGTYSELLVATADIPMAKRKDWIAYSKDMQKLGLELAAEAHKGDKADKNGLLKTMKAIEANCTTCHKDFRR